MTFVLFGLLSSGSFLLKSDPTKNGNNALQALLPLLSRLPPRGNFFGSFAPWDFFFFPPFRWAGEAGGGLGVHLVLCLVGLPLLPLDLGPARGVGVPLGLRLAWAGLLPLLLLLWEEEERELPAHDRRPFPASPSLWILPNSHRTFHDVRIRGSLQSLAPALYPPAIHALRGVDRGRIRGLGHVRVALVDVAIALALAPLPVRGQEVVSVGGGHRPRHALLVVARAVSGRGLLTATALGVEALGRVVTGLDPRIDIGHAVTALGMSGCGLLTATAPAVSVRVPLPVGGSGAIARSPESLA